MASKIAAKQIVGGGSGGAGSGFIVFRPGVPSAGYFVSTWAEVRTAAKQNLRLFIDDSIAPATTDNLPTDMGYVDTIERYNRFASGDVVLEILDGGRLDNLRQVGGVTLRCHSISGPSIGSSDWTKTPVLPVGEGGRIVLAADATQSAIQIPAGGGIVLAVAQGGEINADAAPGNTCVVDLQGATSQMLMPKIQGGTLGLDTVKGVLGSTWTLPFDAFNVDLPFLQPNFAGTLNLSRLEDAALIRPSSGATIDRPTTSVGFKQVQVGQMYFDTDLGKPVWWKGPTNADWVDATGAPALWARALPN